MGRAGILDLAERRRQRAVDVRAAAGVEAVDEAERRFARLVVVLLQLGPEALDLAVVGDDVEHVPVAQVVEHELQRLFGLLDLLAAHAARAIDDEHHRLLRPLGPSRP